MTQQNNITLDIQNMLDSAPTVAITDTDVKPGPIVARGFAAHREFINKKGRPKAKDPRVSISIRLPKSYVNKMRHTGRGWQTRLGNYIVNGISNGML